MTAPILRTALARMIERSDLAESEAFELLLAIADGEQPPAAVGAALAALESKRASAAEIRGLALAMRSLSTKPCFDRGAPLADLAGTGGDGSNSLNLSTGAAILAAACGVRVAKHGNRSVSSRSGSADVLEAMGMVLPGDGAAASACLRETGFTFLFAPNFHPAMKAVAPVRAALGVRTVFNLLGPLANPSAPPYSLVGAFSRDAARLLAEAFSGMAIERVFVVHGEDGWDEPTPAAPFVLFEAVPGDVRERRMSHDDFRLPACSHDELAGGDARENAARLRAILRGEEKSGARDAVVMSAALLLCATGAAGSPAEGAAQAGGAVDDGRAERLLSKLVAFRQGGFDVC